MQLIRDLPSRTYDGRTFWATVRQPKERRTRNRKLLRVAEVLQKCSKLAQVKEKTSFDLVCWRSSTVVLGSRRIVSVKEPDNNFTWADNWYTPDLYAEKQDIVIREIEAIE